MKLLVMLLGTLMVSLGACSKEITRNANKAGEINKASPVTQQQDNKSSAGENVTREQAIGISRSDALRQNSTLTQFHLVTCETVRFWDIIYDPGGPEYLISKRTGRILQVEKLPEGDSDSQRVSREQAIEIVKDDFRKLIKSYGDREENVDRYEAFACELSKTWRIIFEFK